MKTHLIIVASLVLSANAAIANNSINAAVETGDTGLPPGQALMIENQKGGPATGRYHTQTPPELAALVGPEGYDTVGAALQAALFIVK